MLIFFCCAVFIHHLFPKSQLGIRGLAKYDIFSLASIRRGDKHLRRNDSNLIEKLLVHYGYSLSWSHKLCLKFRTLPILAEMLRYIPRNGIYTLLCLIYLVCTTEFFLHIGSLCIGHPLAYTIEISINRVCAYFLWHHTTFVKQRHDSTILYRLIHSVDRLNNTTEFCGCTLLLFHQRCTCHRNKAGIR